MRVSKFFRGHGKRLRINRMNSEVEETQVNFLDIVPFNAEVEQFNPPDISSPLSNEIPLTETVETICASSIRLAQMTSELGH